MQLRALLVLYNRGSTITITIYHAYTSQSSSGARARIAPLDTDRQTQVSGFSFVNVHHEKMESISNLFQINEIV
jgi:hypothetical protein